MRADRAPQKACIEAPPVIGPRNRSKSRRASRVEPGKRLSSEAGRVAVSTGGMKTADFAFQNSVVVKADRHHSRHRVNVRRLMPRASVRQANRFSDTPSSMALISTTIVARYTLRPRNRNDGGVQRDRHP